MVSSGGPVTCQIELNSTVFGVRIMNIEASDYVSSFNFIAMMLSEQVCINLFFMELSTYMSRISDLHIISIILIV